MNNQGYVYFIGSKIFGWYKIGKSKTPVVRIDNIGVLLPFKIEVICVWKAENRHLLETTLHDIYKEKRINGEWFEFTKKEAHEVVMSLPEEARVADSYSTFSNLGEDTKNGRKILRVKVQKKGRDFTEEERSERMMSSISHQRIRKTLKKVTAYTPNGSYQLACNTLQRNKKVKLTIFTSLY